MRSFFLLMLLGCTMSVLAEWDFKDEERLIKDKFLSDAAAAESLVMIRPPGTNGTNLGLEVQLDYYQLTIHEVDESNGYITISFWEKLSWMDTRLSWNVSAYSGVNLITVLPKYIWLPDTSFYSQTLGSSVAKDDPHDAGTKAVISENGQILYTIKRTVPFHCSMDLAFFPFDIQNCSLYIGAWVHHAAEVNFIVNNEVKVIGQFDGSHNDWRINSTSITNHIIYYPCCPEPYQTVELAMVLKRRPEFFYYLFLIPAATIDIVLPFIHFFPPTSSQKTTLAGLLLLCCMILQFMMYQQLRGFAAEQRPVIAKHYEGQMILIILSVVISSITSSLATTTHTTWRVPLFLRKIMNTALRIICCFGRVVKGEFRTAEEPNQIVQFNPTSDLAPIINNAVSDEEEISYSNVKTSLHRLTDQLQVARERRQLETEWYQIALIIDRLTGIIFVTYAVAVYIQYSKEINNYQ